MSIAHVLQWNSGQILKLCQRPRNVLAYETHDDDNNGNGNDDGIDSNCEYAEFSYQLPRNNKIRASLLRAHFSKPDSSMPQAQTQMHPKPPHSLAMAAILLFPLVARKPKKIMIFFFSFVRLPLGRRRFPLSNFFSHSFDTPKTFLGDGNKNGFEFSTKF